jgi:carotenoid cleavage dioxygenase-like enzyme
MKRLINYVITWIFDENRQASDLIILSAAQFDREPLAQIHLPVRVPFGFHGNWISFDAV